MIREQLTRQMALLEQDLEERSSTLNLNLNNNPPSDHGLRLLRYGVDRNDIENDIIQGHNEIEQEDQNGSAGTHCWTV